MNRLKTACAVVLVAAGLGAAAIELARPGLEASCAECGPGPKDKKCADGYVCVDGKCEKKK